MSLAPSTTSGRLARRPFAVGVAAVYGLEFLSQTLLAPPVTAHLHVAPFALVQAVLIAIWTVLHRRRLRDAGRPTAIATGIAALYAIEAALLSIVVALMLESSAGGGAGPDAPILNFFVVLYFLSLLSSDPSLGALRVWIVGFVILMLLPIAIAVGFSVWVGTRPKAVSP